MRVLVTGAAGFVGSTLVDRLLRDGYEVIGIDNFLDYYPRSIKDGNLQAALKDTKFKFIEGNILNVDPVKMLDGVSWIFHQAGQAGVRMSWGSYFETYTSNNILATQRLLECARSSKSLKKLVYASSSSVYGDAESYPTTENVVPKPVSPYGVTKLAGENLVTLYAKNFSLPTVSLRYFTVYGPRQRPDMAFNIFIKSALSNFPIVVNGDGEQSRDFTFIDDIVDANILAAKQGDNGEVFNIGGGSRVSVNDVLNILKKNFKEMKVEYRDKQLGDARHTSADTTFAQKKLGYKPKISLEEGLRREIEWLKQESARA